MAKPYSTTHLPKPKPFGGEATAAAPAAAAPSASAATGRANPLQQPPKTYTAHPSTTRYTPHAPVSSNNPYGTPPASSSAESAPYGSPAEVRERRAYEASQREIIDARDKLIHNMTVLRQQLVESAPASANGELASDTLTIAEIRAESRNSPVLQRLFALYDRNVKYAAELDANLDELNKMLQIADAYHTTVGNFIDNMIGKEFEARARMFEQATRTIRTLGHAGATLENTYPISRVMTPAAYAVVKNEQQINAGAANTAEIDLSVYEDETAVPGKAAPAVPYSATYNGLAYNGTIFDRLIISEYKESQEAFRIASEIVIAYEIGRYARLARIPTNKPTKSSIGTFKLGRDRIIPGSSEPVSFFEWMGLVVEATTQSDSLLIRLIPAATISSAVLGGAYLVSAHWMAEATDSTVANALSCILEYGVTIGAVAIPLAAIGYGIKFVLTPSKATVARTKAVTVSRSTYLFRRIRSLFSVIPGVPAQDEAGVWDDIASAQYLGSDDTLNTAPPIFVPPPAYDSTNRILHAFIYTSIAANLIDYVYRARYAHDAAAKQRSADTTKAIANAIKHRETTNKAVAAARAANDVNRESAALSELNKAVQAAIGAEAAAKVDIFAFDFALLGRLIYAYGLTLRYINELIQQMSYVSGIIARLKANDTLTPSKADVEQFTRLIYMSTSMRSSLPNLKLWVANYNNTIKVNSKGVAAKTAPALHQLLKDVGVYADGALGYIVADTDRLIIRVRVILNANALGDAYQTEEYQRQKRERQSRANLERLHFVRQNQRQQQQQTPHTQQKRGGTPARHTPAASPSSPQYLPNDEFMVGFFDI